MGGFEITACHANRAGHASVSLRDLTSGALVMFHNMPFRHDYGETVQAECERIEAQAAELCAAALQFLQASVGREADPPDGPRMTRQRAAAAGPDRT